MNSFPRITPVSQPKRAFLRLVVGQVQVIGATIAVVLLLRGGVSARAIWAVVVTGIVSLISLLLFRVVWKRKQKE